MTITDKEAEEEEVNAVLEAPHASVNEERDEVEDEPGWLTQQRKDGFSLWGEKLVVPEWLTKDDDDDDDDYRIRNGWLGRDFVHDIHSPVRITEYYVRYGTGQGLPDAGEGGADVVVAENDEENEGGEGTTITERYQVPGGGDGGVNIVRGGIGTQLTGIVQFTHRAESHKGYCHGGSMCSVLDDVIGWCGFVVTGQCLPWSGYTVQINTTLQKPIAIGTTLLIRARVTNLERRKVFISAELVDPTPPPPPPSRLLPLPRADANVNENNNTDAAGQTAEVIHAIGEGLVILNKSVFPDYAIAASLHRWPSSVAMT